MTKENENNKEQEDLKETWVNEELQNEELQVEENIPEGKPSWFSQNKTILGIVAVILLGIAIVWMFKGKKEGPKKEEKTLYMKLSEKWDKFTTNEKSVYIAAGAAIVGGSAYVLYKGPSVILARVKNWCKKRFSKNEQQQPVAGNNTATPVEGVDASAQAAS